MVPASLSRAPTKHCLLRVDNMRSSIAFKPLLIGSHLETALSIIPDAVPSPGSTWRLDILGNRTMLGARTSRPQGDLGYARTTSLASRAIRPTLLLFRFAEDGNKAERSRDLY